MRVIQNDKFLPVLNLEKEIIGYHSFMQVEVEGETFAAQRRMSVEEYDMTYPALRDFIHHALRSNIMSDIRKKLFEGVA